MTKFTRSIVVALAFAFVMTLAVSESHAAFTTPSRTGASSGAPVEVADALKMSTYEPLIDTAIQKMETLAGLLARARDERGAREICAAAERCYLELELVSIRMTMLPPATPAERMRLQSRYERFAAAREKLEGEVARVAAAPALAFHLRSITAPLHGQMKFVRQHQGSSLTSQLQTLRSQIELYRLQHRDAYPDFRRHGWNQLASKTTEDGTITARGAFGPYIATLPRNPLNDNTRLLIVRGAPGRDFRYDKGDAGFVYDEQSGRLWALDADGRLFNEAAGPAHASAD